MLVAIAAALLAEGAGSSSDKRVEPSVIATVLVTLLAIWGLGQIVAWRPRLSTTLSHTEEAALTGLVCAFALAETTAPLIALTVPPFVAALYDGVPGAARALSAQLIAIVPVVLLLRQGPVRARARSGPGDLRLEHRRGSGSR